MHETLYISAISLHKVTLSTIASLYLQSLYKITTRYNKNKHIFLIKIAQYQILIV